MSLLSDAVLKIKHTEKKSSQDHMAVDGPRLKSNVNNEKQREEATQHRRENDGKARQQETEEIRRRYGDLPLVQSRDRKREQRAQLKTVSVEDVGQEITFRCCIHTVRKMSAKLAFVVFRQQLGTV
ncbi:hypothetical protein HO133_009476 [Letharia lupina]|uniref:Uncharacterized protein n=1 Tax=Letharia lupina TaxID=560253 RepID=A0A8H6CLL6_9LECA|nr:uncharacterized protein HO133_009476 [Letharia lupina]KAF6225476.1 hypothetical protein HO133_009476 [Letharia lupina]